MSNKTNCNDHICVGGALVSIAPYEHPLVWSYVGRGRYLQAAFCKLVEQLYSARFGKLTARNLTNIAAEGGSIGVLAWSKEIGCRWDTTVLISGASGGDVEALRYLMANACPTPTEDYYSPAIAAAEGGHVEALEFLIEHGCRVYKHVFTQAAGKGHLNIIKFAHQSECDWSIQNVCEEAAGHGHLHILQWAHETVHVDGIFDELTSAAAAFGGHIEVLQWLRDVSCPWDADTCWKAIQGGHLDALQWAMNAGCPGRKGRPWTVNDKSEYQKHTGLGYAAERGHSHLVEYFINNCDPKMINAANIFGCTPIHLAAMDGDVESVRLLIQAGANLTIAAAGYTPLKAARCGGHLEAAEIIRAAGGRE